MSAAKHTPGKWVADICSEGWGEHVVYVGKGNADAICRLSVRESAFAPDDDEAIANARLIAAAPDLLVACVNARDMLATDRQAFVDCHRLPESSRTEDAIAHGLVWVDEDTWIEPEDAEPLRDYDRAIALINSAILKATGEGA